MILRRGHPSVLTKVVCITLALLAQWDSAIARVSEPAWGFSQDGAAEASRIGGSQPWMLQQSDQQQQILSSDAIIPTDDDPLPSDEHPPIYSSLLNALKTMESHFFEVSHGTWPDAIDWTAEVMATQISSTLAAMTEYAQAMLSGSITSAEQARDHENLINRYFTQITSFYFGENAFSLRTQAYDDMLWVVLGWLESIKFIKKHSSFHYKSTSTAQDPNASEWYAHQFIPQFAHRARLFYELASRGWDTTLCGGGMIWNPYLAPYKNAITNELYIAASVAMYLYFPGDTNPSPFLQSSQDTWKGMPPVKAHDRRYLNNAVEGYNWLKESGMQNSKGLYADGFHVRGWRRGENASNGTGECDMRAETVYTYNQGVILSAQRGLWEATGSREYLEDAHSLIRNVISATGFEERGTPARWRWAGLGRNGVLEEICDWSGSCSQDAQTFKGIFFHHFTLFCSPLPVEERDQDRPWLGDQDVAALHQQSCDGYGTWVDLNAHAAILTRDENGEFGQWWGRASKRRDREDDGEEDTDAMEAPSYNEPDYRNRGVPDDEIWRLSPDEPVPAQWKLGRREHEDALSPISRTHALKKQAQEQDINDRGRGRTVETQSGGVAVLRAMWKLVESRTQ